MTPDEYCQQKASASGSSFYYSFLFLPPERRRAITAVYAYCREVDDVVDEVSDATAAEATLAWWRSEIEQLFRRAIRRIPSPAPCSRSSSGEFGISKQRLNAILDGMQFDLRQNRLLDFAALQRYAIWWLASSAKCLQGFSDIATRRHCNMRPGSGSRCS